MKSYRHGLSFAPSTARLDELQFHQVVMEALPICKAAWPAIRKGQVRNRIASCKVLQGIDDVENVSDHAIEFSIRMWFMLDCFDLGTESTPSKWPNDMPLAHFANADSWFSAYQANPEDAQKTFPRKFTARQLSQIAGITVRWADLLSEHLVFNEKSEQLVVFRSAAWLIQMLELKKCPHPGRGRGPM